MVEPTKQYDRVSKALEHIAESEGMVMAVLHYYCPNKEAVNSVVFAANAAVPLASIVIDGVDRAFHEYDVRVECECGGHDDDIGPVLGIVDLLDDDEGQAIA